MTQVGAPAVGEVLADRYRLEEHIHNDSTGRQVWRGVDVLLRRPVTIVLRYPGGEPAEEMLQAAVAASRVVHPHTVGVYDAVDEGERAYVVREFVDGRTLRDVVTTSGPLSATRATAVAHAIADALAAVHATGVAHGNVHAGTVLLGADDRIVLADARAGNDASQDSDIRGLGGVLYAALTGTWPDEVPGDGGLPAAPHDDGALTSPRQSHPQVPNYLDALTMDLLDEALPTPSAAELSGELGRLDLANEVSGPLDLVGADPPEQATSRTVWKKIVLGVACLAVLSLLGLLIGTQWMGGGGTSPGGSPDGGASASPSQAAERSAPKAIEPTAVRIIDPQGDGTELADADKTTDDDPQSAWEPQEYTGPDFGNLKDGMGVLVDLGSKHDVSTVSVVFTDGGATAGLMAGDSDPADGADGNQQADGQLVDDFKTVKGADQDRVGVRKSWTLSGVKTRYVLLWITSMPQIQNGKYQVGVRDIKVRGQ